MILGLELTGLIILVLSEILGIAILIDKKY